MLSAKPGTSASSNIGVESNYRAESAEESAPKATSAKAKSPANSNGRKGDPLLAGLAKQEKVTVKKKRSRLAAYECRVKRKEHEREVSDKHAAACKRVEELEAKRDALVKDCENLRAQLSAR